MTSTLNYSEYMTRELDTMTAAAPNSDQLYSVPKSLVIFFFISYGCVSIVAVLGNILVITVICAFKTMRSVTNLFIANLAYVYTIIIQLSILFNF
jgi:hypothetical protein